MHSFSIQVGPNKADIGVALSAAIAAENPVGSTAGRGVVRLFNTDDNASVYLSFGNTEPGSDVAGILLPIGQRFPEDIQITSDGGVWAWSGSEGTRLNALVVGWS